MAWACDNRAVRPSIAKDDHVVVGCSGGGDSVALLHLFHRLSPRRRPSLLVAHLDHGMRRGSKADRAFVERLAAKLGIPCVSDRREVPAARRKGESPEEAARRVRRGFLLETASRAGATKVALGHTLDDQAETILMRLVRGSGPTALLGMTATGPGPLVRPLLAIERGALRAWLKRRRIAFREDPSNRDLRFERNRVRRIVMPLLAERLNPKAARHLVQGMERLREDARCLDALAQEAFERAGADPESLAAFPEAIAGRMRALAALRRRAYGDRSRTAPPVRITSE
jgi:tRNA(Ile)-lysidine synthase